jgi:hypothetical protein
MSCVVAPARLPALVILACGACGGRPAGATSPPGGAARPPEGARLTTPVSVEESWQVRTGCTLNAVGVLDDGTIVVGGGYRSGAVLGDAQLAETTLTEAALVAGFDPSGKLLWHRESGDRGDDYVKRVVPLGSEFLVSGIRAAGMQGFVALYGHDGQLRWERTTGLLLVGEGWHGTLEPVGAPEAIAPADGGGAWLLFAASTGSAVVRVDAGGSAAERVLHADAIATADTRLAVDSRGDEYVFGEGTFHRLELSRYARDGSTWTAQVAESFVRGSYSLAAGLEVDAATGDAFVAWEETNTGLHVARLRAADGARAWVRAIPVHLDRVDPDAPATELVGFDRDARTGNLFLSVQYRLPFALSGVVLRAPLQSPDARPVASGGVKVDLVSRAVAEVEPGAGRVVAAGPFVPNDDECSHDYLTRIVWWPGLVFSNGAAYVVTGEAPPSSTCLAGPEGAIVAKLSVR